MAPKRCVVAKERASTYQNRKPVAACANPFIICFQKAEQEACYNHLLERKITNTCYLDSQALTFMGLYNDVVWIFEQIGWQWFLQLAQPTYIPLTLVFQFSGGQS